MADNADAPAVKDLPKLGDHIKDEIVKDVQLKHIEVRTQSLSFQLGLWTTKIDYDTQP